MEVVGKVLAVFVVFLVYSTISASRCSFRHSAFRWPRKSCVFVVDNKTETKYIGLQLRLNDDKKTKRAFSLAKANFYKFYHGPVTVWSHRCNCTEVPCLTEEQVNIMFAFSIEKAHQEAKSSFPSLPSLCCSLQIALVKIVYSLETQRLSELVKRTLGPRDINMQKWETFLNGLRQTNWCKSFRSNCKLAENYIYKGCQGYRKRRGLDFEKAASCQTSTCGHGKKDADRNICSL